MVNENQDPGSYFLALARLAASRASGEVGVNDDEEDAPTELNTINCSGGFMVVSPDKLSVQYKNLNLHGYDVGVVQANRPAPFKRLVYYFELFVKNAGAKGQIAIGFTNDSFKLRRQPGWEANSYGYHGDDGYLYRGHGTGETFGPTYTTNDTVGAGINYALQEFFFTKNGSVVGSTIPKDVKGALYPTVSVHSQNEEVSVNFGKQPFTFDLKAFEAQVRMKQQMTIEKIHLQQNVSYGIVRSYLQHYGYEDTLNAFDVASKTSVPPISIAEENGSNEQDHAYALGRRKALRQLIRNGQIDAALAYLREWYPQIVQDDKSVSCFLLHCQNFIELVKGGDLVGAVQYGKLELAKFFEVPVFENLVKDCVALLAYNEPQKSSLGYLLKDSQREIVADTINAMVLSTNPNMKDSKSCFYSCLEKLLMQLTTCCLERRFLNGDQGEAFNLNSVLYRDN